MGKAAKISTAIRRRGAELEDALLDAAWDELVAKGYLGLTFEGVAERASTSRPVVNRRWATKAELISAAVQHEAAKLSSLRSPDTGSLRGDMIALLQHIAEDCAEWIAVMTAQLAGYFDETGTSHGDLSYLVRDRYQVFIDEVVSRGQIDLVKLSPRVRNAPFDLLAFEMIMTLKPVSPDFIRELVDEIFLPLVRP